MKKLTIIISLIMILGISKAQNVMTYDITRAYGIDSMYLDTNTIDISEIISNGNINAGGALVLIKYENIPMVLNTNVNPWKRGVIQKLATLNGWSTTMTNDLLVGNYGSYDENLVGLFDLYFSTEPERKELILRLRHELDGALKTDSIYLAKALSGGYCIGVYRGALSNGTPLQKKGGELTYVNPNTICIADSTELKKYW